MTALVFNKATSHLYHAIKSKAWGTTTTVICLMKTS